MLLYYQRNLRRSWYLYQNYKWSWRWNFSQTSRMFFMWSPPSKSRVLPQTRWPTSAKFHLWVYLIKILCFLVSGLKLLTLFHEVLGLTVNSMSVSLYLQAVSLKDMHPKMTSNNPTRTKSTLQEIQKLTVSPTSLNVYDIVHAVLRFLMVLTKYVTINL